MNKIVEGMKDAVRFAKGEDVGARVTHYPAAKQHDWEDQTLIMGFTMFFCRRCGRSSNHDDKSLCPAHIQS